MAWFYSRVGTLLKLRFILPHVCGTFFIWVIKMIYKKKKVKWDYKMINSVWKKLKLLEIHLRDSRPLLSDVNVALEKSDGNI